MPMDLMLLFLGVMKVLKRNILEIDNAVESDIVG